LGAKTWYLAMPMWKPCSGKSCSTFRRKRPGDGIATTNHTPGSGLSPSFLKSDLKLPRLEDYAGRSGGMEAVFSMKERWRAGVVVTKPGTLPPKENFVSVEKILDDRSQRRRRQLKSQTRVGKSRLPENHILSCERLLGK